MRFVPLAATLAALLVSGTAPARAWKNATIPSAADEPHWRILMDSSFHDFDHDVVLEFQAPGPGEGKDKVGFRSVAARPLENRHDECQEQARTPSRSTLRPIDVLRKTLKVLLEAAGEAPPKHWDKKIFHREMAPVRHECKANTGHRALTLEKIWQGETTRYRIHGELSPAVGKYARALLTDFQREGLRARSRDCRDRIEDRWKEPLTRYFEMTRDRGPRRRRW